ncbi:CHAT domain-containing protein [Streptomyces sp. ISL-112]|uniref:CHAT domain-containing protein n=1 Tax=unclassified Streptomyces TaxID=2593676 RepID=UPI001BE5B748|nr:MULTISPECIES: CHAT domain-containing protein [unclassified Streptomyces]MBT2426027.1 CHAT domain-containing protein [Streptomyces sp. ISL-112]MBT2461434.1 CHAT domain-containing protein [Streptomyces sp. ISL-63]
MTPTRAEDAARRILQQAERADAEPGVLEWFAGPEAARAADEVLGSIALPDGSAWALGVLALGYADLFRYAARGAADRGALATALLRFGVVHEQDPEQVPFGLRPLFATLSGEPDGAATHPGLAYDAGVGMMTVFQRGRDPGVLRMAETLLRHAATVSGQGSVEQGVCLSDLGLVLFYGFQDGVGRQALSDAVGTGRAAVVCAPGDRDEQARRHSNFGHTLRHWADVTGDMDAMRESVAELRKAVELCTENSPHRAQHSATLGSALCLAADHLDDPALRSQGVALLRTALAEPDAAVANRAGLLSDLGVALFAEAVASGSGDELHEEGVAACRGAADTAPNAFERATYLINLGLMLAGVAARTGRPGLLDDAYDTAREALDGAPSGHPVRGRAHFALSQVLDARYTATGSMGDLDEAVAQARRATECAPADDVARRVLHATGHAELLWKRAVRHVVATGEPGDPGELDDPVTVLRALAAEVPARSAERARILLALGRCLQIPGDTDGLDEAVDCYHKCLALPPPTGSFRATTRFALGAALARRAGADDDAAWRRGSEEMLRGLGLLRADGPEHWDCHAEYTHALMDRADATNEAALYEEGVRLLREEVRHAPLPRAESAVRRSNIGFGLLSIATCTGRTELLPEAVAAHREAVALSSAQDPFSVHLLMSLGEALLALAEFRSDTEALEEGVAVLRRAVAVSDASTYSGADCRTALGDALRNLARLTADDAPLEESVRCHREAVAMAAGPPSPQALLGLANSLGALYRRTGDARWSDEAVRHYEAALAAPQPVASSLRGTLLTGLGYVRWSRAVDSGDERLMDLAVATLREAVTHVLQMRRGMALTNLGSALMNRGLATGNRVWLAEAVTVLRRAVKESPPAGVERSLHLNNLAEALRCWYEAVGDRSAADEAAGLLREAMAVEHGDRSGAEMAGINLGVLLTNRAHHDEDLRIADEARRVLEEVVAGFGEHHPARPYALQKLASACTIVAALARERAEDVARRALHRAEAAAREALAGTSADRAQHGPSQMLLAWVQLARTALGDRVDLVEVARVARDGAHNPVAPVAARIRAAHAWGRAAVKAGHDADALEGYAYAVGLLPGIAPRSLARADQEARLLVSEGLASDAAALALDEGAADRALALLEQGRGVLLAQGLEDRADVSRLHTLAPGLAAEFERIRGRLSEPARPSPVPAPGVDGPAAPFHGAQEAAVIAEARHALARRWEQLIAQIRELPGLDDFLRPPSVAELVASAAEGPVVVVNVSTYRCDALVVTADAGIDVVPLPDLTLEATVSRAAEFIEGVDTAYGENGVEEAVAMMRTLSGTLGWLWDAVAAPVLDHLGLDSVPRDGDPWPRLWWCPTGRLSFLPLHAAGRGAADSGTWVVDRAVSSYTPTLRALVRARGGRGAGGSTHPAPLVVALAETPGAAPLPGVSREVELLMELFPQGRLLAGPDATVEAVGRALEAHPWVHFSCHGVSELLNPSRSGLILYDGRLTASDAAARRPGNPELAVLSACSAAQGGITLSDEAVQLASSFQLAGYPHVIGTLWPVADKLATHLTEEFYAALAEDLARGRPIDPATALHRPVRALRDRYAQAPHLWAAHIHTGP